VSTTRNLALAVKTKRHGASYSLRIILEARRAGLPISLGFALIEQESAFRNIWGSDRTASGSCSGGICGNNKTVVTKARYLQYKRTRDQLGMQGVGPAQLTWWEFQDQADRLGGCWVPKNNIRVAFSRLAELIKLHGVRDGIRRYNGAGPAAVAYAQSVLERQAKWHRRLS
jgi:hypothetical protein